MFLTKNIDVDRLILQYVDLERLEILMKDEYVSKVCNGIFWFNKLSLDYPLHVKHIEGIYLLLLNQDPYKLYSIISGIKTKIITISHTDLIKELLFFGKY